MSWSGLQSEPRYQATVPMPFGYVVVRSSATELLSVDLALTPLADSEGLPALLSEARRQIRAYLADSSFRFDLPIKETGTPYQRTVWESLREIPVSQTKTYGQLATELGSGPRAIAMACRSNEFPIIIPCHRVVAQGGLGGYAGHRAGQMLDFKKCLLRHEGAAIA